MNGNLKMERPTYTISLKRYAARDGARIACRVFEPRENIRAVLVFLHGAALNSQLYTPIGVRLASNFRVQAVFVDMRGHGESDGKRGHVKYIGQLEDDMHDIMSILKRESNGLPLFLGAHSAGSSVIVRYAGLKCVTPPDGYVFVASTVLTMNGEGNDINTGAQGVVSKFHRRRLILLDHLNRLGITAFNTLPIMHFRNPRDIGARAEHEVISSSYTMFRQMDFQNYLYGFKNIDRPLFMIIGQADTLVQPEDLKLVFDRYVPSVIDKTFKVLPKCDHFSVVWGAGREIGEWITKRLKNNVEKGVGSIADMP